MPSMGQYESGCLKIRSVMISLPTAQYQTRQRTEEMILPGKYRIPLEALNAHFAEIMKNGERRPDSQCVWLISVSARWGWALVQE